MSPNIPPKQTVTGAPAAADPAFGKPFAEPAEEAGALVSIHNAALHANPDSFPVLKAFQDYLETERKRARQRLVLLSAFFAILLVAVMLALIGIGVYLFGNMSQTQNQLLTAVLEQRATPAAPAPVEPARPALDPDALARTIEERVAAALAAAAPRPAAPAPLPDATAAELSEIKAALAALQRENEALKAQPKIPPTVGPIIPRAAVAHLLDPPAAQPAAPPKPATPAPAATPPPPPLPETARTATPATPLAAAAPAAPATAAGAAPARKPLEQPPAAVADGYRAQAGRMTLDIPSKDPDTVIPWRIVLPPR